MSSNQQQPVTPENGGTVPYSRDVPKDRKDRLLYNLADSRQVPYDETLISKVLAEHEDRLNAAKAGDFYHGKLMAAVHEAAKLQADVDRNIKEHNQRVAKENDPIDKELTKLLAIEQGILQDRFSAQTKLNEKLPALTLENAKAHGEAGLELDPEKALSKSSIDELQMKPEADAAKWKIPQSQKEKTVFASPMIENMKMGLVGAAQGLSVGAVSGAVPLSAIAKFPIQSIFFALIGISIAIGAGGSIKAAWRGVSESKLLGNPWIGAAVLASFVTAFVIVVQVTLDYFGLMAYQRLHSDVASISGQANTSNQPNPVMFILCGAAISAIYALYCAFAGWRKERFAADNRVVLAQEEERIALLKEFRTHDGWTKALASSNAVVAWKALDSEFDKVYEAKLGHIQKRREKLTSLLKEYRTTGTDDEIALLEKQRVAVSGLWREFYKLLEALDEGAAKTSQRASLTSGAEPGLWQRVKNFFSRSQGGSR